MVTIDSNAERQSGVTLVAATVEGEERPVRVHLASRLDGPVWPPRRQGRPVAGWDADQFEGVVPADGTLGVGFASPAEAVEPALKVTAVEPAAAAAEGMDSPAAVVRGLGDPTPPSLVATDEPPRDESIGSTSELNCPGRNGSNRDGPTTDESDCEPEARATDEGTGPLQGGGTGALQVTGEPSPPPALASWLSTVEARLDCADGLEAGAAVEAATESLRDCGGVEGARHLERTLEQDAATLRTIERRAGTLADHAETVTVATEALNRLP